MCQSLSDHFISVSFNSDLRITENDNHSCFCIHPLFQCEMISILTIAVCLSSAVATLQVRSEYQSSEGIITEVYKRLVYDTFESIDDLRILISESSFDGIRARKNGLRKTLRACKDVDERRALSLVDSPIDWGAVNSFTGTVLAHLGNLYVALPIGTKRLEHHHNSLLNVIADWLRFQSNLQTVTDGGDPEWATDIRERIYFIIQSKRTTEALLSDLMLLESLSEFSTELNHSIGGIRENAEKLRDPMNDSISIIREKSAHGLMSQSRILVPYLKKMCLYLDSLIAALPNTRTNGSNNLVILRRQLEFKAKVFELILNALEI
jgi:hypothetical protein